MKQFIRNLIVHEDGPTAVEYAVLLALIIVVCLGAVNTMANSTAASFDASAAEIESALGS